MMYSDRRSTVRNNVRTTVVETGCPKCYEGYITEVTQTWLGCWSGSPDRWEPESEIDTTYEPCGECGNDDPDYQSEEEE